MKYCTNCGTELPDEDIKYCPACGAAQSLTITESSQKSSSGSFAALVTLCILTILGSVLGILKGLFLEAFNSHSYDSMNQFDGLPLGYASALFNLGTLVGAILMLNKMRIGYILYLIFQCANIFAVIFWVLNSKYFEQLDRFMNPILLLTSSVTIIPSLLFIALYTFMVRKQLH